MHEPPPSADGNARLARITLGGETPARISPLQQADRAQAVHDLAVENSFYPAHAAPPGPYALQLCIQDGRLVFDISCADGAPVRIVALALGPFRRLVKDYQMLVDSHEAAVHEGREARIQAIDMGRRGLHNEGAALLMQRLDGKVAIDFATARRLFTLLCVLHQRA